jgi:hypothetical protein
VVVSTNALIDLNSTNEVRLPLFNTTPETNFELKDTLKFGVCVPPLFGHIPSTTLVEFVELNRLLGANHIIFYVHQVSSVIMKVLDYYQEQHIVTVISWDIPVRDEHIWYHGQILAINDCLYRTMHHFSHVVFSDIDEFLVPHLHDSWHGMINHLERFGPSAQNDTKICGFSFQSAFFDPMINGNNNVLYDLESYMRTKSISNVMTTVMIRPQRIF